MSARPSDRLPAYDAIQQFIRDLGTSMPADAAHRNALIWRAVDTALDAVGIPSPGQTSTSGTARPVVGQGEDLPLGGPMEEALPRRYPGQQVADQVLTEYVDEQGNPAVEPPC